MWVVLGAVALLLLGGGILLIRHYVPVIVAERSTARATPAPEAGATRVREKDGAVMVYVPAGEFWMGSKEGEPGVGYDEKPRHKVFVDAFWIDHTEVTNAQYRQCVEAKVCSSPGPGFSSSLTRENYYGNPEYDDYPVIGVTWDRAREYAAWVGGRLPTEAEWEYACRGPGESSYSWGNPPPDESLLNYNGNVGDTTKVGSYPGGESWCGALDVGGNVWEWTQSLYQGYPYDPADGREDLGADGSRVLRGGAYYSGADAVRCGRRDMADIRVGDGSVGFRVVVSPD
jgi:formylglycine-generating enzyme required for sulfatase activity